MHSFLIAGLTLTLICLNFHLAKLAILEGQHRLQERDGGRLWTRAFHYPMPQLHHPVQFQEAGEGCLLPGDSGKISRTFHSRGLR